MCAQSLKSELRKWRAGVETFFFFLVVTHMLLQCGLYRLSSQMNYHSHRKHPLPHIQSRILAMFDKMCNLQEHPCFINQR